MCLLNRCDVLLAGILSVPMVAIVWASLDQRLALRHRSSNISPIVHVWSSSQRDAIFLLYDNGAVSMRCRKRLYTVANTPALAETESFNQDPVMVSSVAAAAGGAVKAPTDQSSGREYKSPRCWTFFIYFAFQLSL